MNPQLVLHTAALIQRYLATRPEAADTLEGIHLWWIDWPQSPEALEVTQAALVHLQSQGIMTSVHIGKRQLWRMAQ